MVCLSYCLIYGQAARETINQQGGGRDKLVQVSRGVKRKAEDQAINENEGKSHCGEVIWIKGEAGGVGKSIHLPDKTAENKSRSSSGREGKEVRFYFDVRILIVSICFNCFNVL